MLHAQRKNTFCRHSIHTHGVCGIQKLKIFFISTHTHSYMFVYGFYHELITSCCLWWQENQWYTLLKHVNNKKPFKFVTPFKDIVENAAAIFIEFYLRIKTKRGGGGVILLNTSLMMGEGSKTRWCSTNSLLPEPWWLHRLETFWQARSKFSAWFVVCMVYPQKRLVLKSAIV